MPINQDNVESTVLAPPSPHETAEGAMSAPVSPSPFAVDRWQAWDDFLEATPETGFMQSSWWADFRVTVGYEHFAAILKDRNLIVGGAMVQNRNLKWDSDGPSVKQFQGTRARK